MQHHRPIHLGIALSSLLAVLCASCGTEEYVYLFAPYEYNSPSSTSLTRNMRHNTDNAGNIFQGYQLYYKIYGCSSQTEAPALALTEASAIESSSSSPDVVFTKLTSTYGYKPVLAFSSSGERISTPIVKIAKTDTGHSIYSSFEFGSGTASTIDNDNAASTESFLIRRSEADSNSSSTTGYKEFTDLSTASSDTDDIVTTNGSAHYWIRIYALAYGLDSTTWANVYSSPAVLANTIYLGANGSK